MGSDLSGYSRGSSRLPAARKPARPRKQNSIIRTLITGVLRVGLRAVQAGHPGRSVRPKRVGRRD